MPEINPKAVVRRDAAKITVIVDQMEYQGALTRQEEVITALAEVGLPMGTPLSVLIKHHRANAALAAGFDLITYQSAIKSHTDAIDGYDGSLRAHNPECIVCKILSGEE